MDIKIMTGGSDSTPEIQKTDQLQLSSEVNKNIYGI